MNRDPKDVWQEAYEDALEQIPEAIRLTPSAETLAAKRADEVVQEYEASLIDDAKNRLEQP